MTERLTQLLHDEATGLVPPPPDAASVIGAGRRIRQRRRVTGAVVATVAAVVVTSVGVGLLGGSPEARDVGPTSPDAATPAPAAYGVGSDVHVGDRVAQVPDTVHSLHYTSVGVLVRSNPNGGASDGSGPESLTLVRWDGSTEDLGTIPEGVGPATDPARDVYVLAEPEGDGFVAVVRDAGTGEVVQTVPLPDLPPSYWEVPPLTLDADRLFVGYRTKTAVVDLATGETSIAEGLDGGMQLVRGGHVVAGDGESLSVLDAATGQPVLDVEVEPGTAPYGMLSPDGRFLRVVRQDLPPGAEDVMQVYDVSTGSVQEFAGSDGWGWTSDGDPFRVGGGTLTRCEADTGDCTDSPAPGGPGTNADVRLGGMTYES
ncbi:hypothetical protein GCM10009623_06190 [Nocardioides aestuarii]|uniref:Uncharacterized protein n=1 Tax=Nocardioides aestuarii TaxID=252231 RepID=A0ABW4TG04_9ACTN